jgi:NitT/TauT family transport system ATP-binding protein
VEVRYGDTQAISNVSLDIPAGQFVSIVGPTGCGKSSLLNLVAGLAKPSSGDVLSGGTTVRGINPDCSYLFQADALVPWKTALGNVILGPILRGVPRGTAQSQARDLLRLVGLEGLEGRYSHQLSGGQQKRVALAQALINRPGILLMDEPFSALDAQTRSIMEQELVTLCRDINATVLFVTHDLEEAIALADRVVLFTAGPSSHIRADVPVPLPRSRDVAGARFLDGFTDLFQELWTELRDEVNRSYDRSRTDNSH